MDNNGQTSQVGGNSQSLTPFAGIAEVLDKKKPAAPVEAPKAETKAETKPKKRYLEDAHDVRVYLHEETRRTGDKLKAAASVMETVNRYRERGRYETLLGAVSAFVMGEFRGQKLSEDDARAATQVWMERARRRPKFTPDSFEHAVVCARQKRLNDERNPRASEIAGWAFSVALQDDRLTDQEVAEIAAHLIRRTPELDLPAVDVAQTLLKAMAEVKECPTERVAAVRSNLKPAIISALLLLSNGLRDAERAANAAVEDKRCQAERRAQPPKRDEPKRVGTHGGGSKPKAQGEVVASTPSKVNITPTPAPEGGRSPEEIRAYHAKLEAAEAAREAQRQQADAQARIAQAAREAKRQAEAKAKERKAAARAEREARDREGRGKNKGKKRDRAAA